VPTSTSNAPGHIKQQLSRLSPQPAPLLAAMTALMLFGVLLATVQARWEPLTTLDHNVATALHDLLDDRHALTAVTQFVTNLGGGVTWLVLLSSTALYLLVRGQQRLALFVAVATLGGRVLNRAVKTTVGRERPELADPVSHAAGWAFPSGHAMGSAIGISVLLLVFLPLLAPRWRPSAIGLGILFAAAVGASRVMLGVHWLSDVLGAWLLSLAWMLAMIALLQPAGVCAVRSCGRNASAAPYAASNDGRGRRRQPS
jgi:undecaprenyl-diphosphatase